VFTITANIGETFRRDGLTLAAGVVLLVPGAYLATVTTAASVEEMKGPWFNS
jgi:hypothetical protein